MNHLLIDYNFTLTTLEQNSGFMEVAKTFWEIEANTAMTEIAKCMIAKRLKIALQYGGYGCRTSEFTGNQYHTDTTEDEFITGYIDDCLKEEEFIIASFLKDRDAFERGVKSRLNQLEKYPTHFIINLANARSMLDLCESQLEFYRG